MRLTRFPSIMAQIFLTVTVACTSATSVLRTSDWKTCRDNQHGFSLNYPSDWESTTSEGRCVQLQKGEVSLPAGIPEVDVFIQVMPLRDNFPDDHLANQEVITQGQTEERIDRGILYNSREELEINGLSAVQAKFESFGPTPNWGLEYRIRNGDQILSIYISQPEPEIEMTFIEVVNTIQWK